jgi:CRISPR/Cas system-associated exonuclease Cas4 (RecB family)
MIPVDIKYASYPFLSTDRVKQIVAYSILLDHNFHTNTRRGIVYYPQQNKQDSIKISASDKESLMKDLERIRSILSSEKIPRKTARVFRKTYLKPDH